MTNKIICAEKTADGPRHFVVESEAAFDALVILSDRGSAEADMWGGFEFDVDLTPQDEDNDDGSGFWDADGTTVAEYLTHDPITLKQVQDAEPEADEYDEDGMASQEAYEDAYLGIIQG